MDALIERILTWKSDLESLERSLSLQLLEPVFESVACTQQEITHLQVWFFVRLSCVWP